MIGPKLDIKSNQVKGHLEILHTNDKKENLSSVLTYWKGESLKLPTTNLLTYPSSTILAT